MNYVFKRVGHPVHRLIPSRYPPVSLFDWADSVEELEQIAALEGLTNDRLLQEYGQLNLIAPQDWVGGEGSTPLMAAFTHPGPSRFTNGNYGIYYAADSLETAISETKFHREQFLGGSQERPCLIQMREYRAQVKEELVDLFNKNFDDLLDPDLSSYPRTQAFGQVIKDENHWGLVYPSVRRQNGTCVAVFRPKALSIPVQGVHLEYIWDGKAISEVRTIVTSGR